MPVLWLVAAAACLPLSSIAGAEALLERSWSPAVAALLHQQVAEPRAERRLQETIPRLTAIDDEVSLAVQRQYEENPYPRWVRPAPAAEPRTLGQVFGDWASRRTARTSARPSISWSPAAAAGRI